MALGSLASKPAFLARLRPVLAARRLCAVPPPVSPQRTEEPSPYMQLLPACLSGVAIGTYASVPGVLGPHIARTQGVLAQVASDFSMSAIPPTVVSAGLVSGVLSIALAPHVKTLGARRIALAGSVLFPLGFFALPACAASMGHWSSFVASTSVLGGVGFWCVYPQLPPLLTRWFRERQGLAVSIYFASFGSGLVVATSAIERLLSAFRSLPSPRRSAASIVATSSAILWALDRNTFRQIVMQKLVERRTNLEERWCGSCSVGILLGQGHAGHESRLVGL